MASKLSQISYYTGLGLPPDLAEELVAVDHVLDLPRRLPIPYDTNEATGWAGHYGGSIELFRHANGIKGLFPGLNATWQHAIIEPWRYNDKPFQLLGGVKHPHDRLILVATTPQRELLIRLGYNNVHAIGSAYAYAKPRVLPARIPGSILYMPAHSLDGSPQQLGQRTLAYCDYLESQHKHTLDNIFVCLHMACLRNNFFWPTLRRRGVSIVSGADYCDGRSYRRMWHLFSRFETVSTNTLGSHVFYALAAGSRVLFSGPRHHLSEEDVSHASTFRRSVENGENFMRDPNWHATTDRFLDSLSSGLIDPSYGESEIGLDNVMTPYSIRKLLGWSYLEQLRQFPLLVRRLVRRYRFT